MTVSLLASLSSALLGWLMGFLSLFLIMLILIQRGKGGGLTGALGGPGGQSAFGSKAGDTFTVITIAVASFWGFTCAFTMWLLGTHTPSTVAESSISAGPGDEDRDDSIPASGLNSDSGFSEFDGLGLGGSADDSATSGTPSADLVPTTSETTEAASTETDSAVSDAPETQSPPASDGSETETPKTETPEAPKAETPETEASESDASEGDSGTSASSDKDSDLGSDEN